MNSQQFQLDTYRQTAGTSLIDAAMKYASVVLADVPPEILAQTKVLREAGKLGLRVEVSLEDQARVRLWLDEAGRDPKLLYEVETGRRADA